LHRSIIGKQGNDVRELMNRYDVHIELSPQDQKLDVIKVSGAAQNVREAKEAIADRVKDLEKGREDRELRSFELKIQVEPELHPKIIGRRGAVINKIRASHGVQISFPRKEDAGEDQSTIRIQGYEDSAKAARDEILQIVGDYNEMVKETVPLDARIHSRIIGQRGRHVRQIMEDFHVDIKFPREGDADMNHVTVMGKEEDVEACKDHLLNLEEEYMQDVSEAPKQGGNVTYENLFENAMKKNSHAGGGKSGFVVQGAPWERAPNKDSQIDFPDFGLGGASNVKDTQSLASAWNPNR
jgi:predicted PilT family ATPase